MKIASGILLMMIPSALSAQAVPGTNLVLDVDVDSIALGGDTAWVEYVVGNSQSSFEPLFTFAVSAPAHPVQIAIPSPEADWMVTDTYRSVPVALWGALTDALSPGDSGLVLAFAAVGLPTIVEGWYRGYSSPPPIPDSIGVDDSFDPMTEASVAIKTVGVEPIPSMDASMLLDRLGNLIGEVCEEGWITQAPVCQTLADLAAQALAETDAGNGAEARGLVDSLRTEVADARQQLYTNGSAYWLLEINAAYARDLIPVASGVILPVSADTYLRRGAPNRNQGDEGILRIRSSGNNRALVAVDAAALAALNGPVAQAHLELDIIFNAGNWGTEGRTIDAHRMLVPWTHFGATWNCADDLDPGNQSPDCPTTEWEMRTLDPSPYEPTPTGTLLVADDLTGVVSIDVTADVNAMLEGQVPSYGWIIRKTEEGQNGHIQIASFETQSGPRLVIVE